jgi:uncharacterized SAM-binding protein YcdF (DUF218 family)
MKLLVQLAFLWIVWLVSPRRWRHVMTILLSAIAIGLGSISAWGIQISLWGLTVWLPADMGEATDAVVVLGRGEAFRDLRTGVAHELWQARRAPKIFASGMMDARLIVQSLKALEVPAQNLSGEECSRSTQENALFTATLLQPDGVRHILLVTDAPHMLRSVLIFRRNGFRVTPHAVSLPAQFSPIEQQRSLLREYLALVRYIFAGEIAKPVLKSPPVAPEVMKRIRDWNCWVQRAT